MNIYNSLTRKKESYDPAADERINLFVCGPTVYDYSHIGHARTYLAYDSLVRYLRTKLDWDVFYLQNITDIDDKIIERAQQESEAPAAIAERYTSAYLKDMEHLGIDTVSQYAPATQHIPEIVSQVERLVEKEYAYEIPGDGYYFDISTFSAYGKLSGRTAQQAEDAVSRIDDSSRKRNTGDFALWKLSQAEEPGWESSLGYGRPGWHIEDTAIAEKYFGFTYHLHGGAMDLKFPHHEAEIAQMEALSGVSPMVKIWVHTGFLTINGEKMSKSTGNFITIRNFLAEYSPEVLRMIVFSSHYRSPLDYSTASAQEAQAALRTLSTFRDRLAAVETTGSAFPYQEFTTAFWDALKDDFNTPKARAVLYNLMGETNKLIDAHTLSRGDAQELLGFLGKINAIFKLLPPQEAVAPQEVHDLVAAREQARAEKDFKKADKLRKDIADKGYGVNDTDTGPRIYKI